MPATECSEDFFQGDNIVIYTSLEGSGSIAGCTLEGSTVRESRSEVQLCAPTVTIRDAALRQITITFSRDQAALLQVNEHEEAGRAVPHLTFVRMQLDNLWTTFGPAKFGVKRSPLALP